MAPLIDAVDRKSDLFDPATLKARLERAGHQVAASPADPEVIRRIESALNRQLPLSVVRIGDGEMNLMALLDEASPAHPIAHWASHTLMSQQADTGGLALVDLEALGKEVRDAALDADVLGVVGLWPTTVYSRKRWAAFVSADPRGAGGQAAARVWADQVVADLHADTMITSAHLYLGVCAELGSIAPKASRVICLTNHPAAVEVVRRLADGVETILVGVGSGAGAAIDQLRVDLRALRPGDLCLIGGGPWAEPYCRWAKQAGAVAIDIGSGFDLLAGMTTRPVHRHPEATWLVSRILATASARPSGGIR